MERLGQSPAAESVSADVSARLDAGTAEGTRPEIYLAAWVTVLEFLRRSVPRDLVDSDDPEEALRHMQAKIGTLISRLESQERDFRVSTADVARSIRSSINTEQRRIGRLSQNLGRVHFGSILGVELKVTVNETMQILLEQLQTPPQTDLFRPQMTLEAVMAEMYRQVSAGKVKGDTLLDYRQYLDIRVRVLRLGSDQWTEIRRDISTGEAIGIGASIMLVILESFEHQAELIHQRRGKRSLRYLFLDEASRLSGPSIETMADFCENMGIQLLVAAPKGVATRGKIFTLVRGTDDNNQPRVFVHARRYRPTSTPIEPEEVAAS
jgi:chromosome partition protein MukB